MTKPSKDRKKGVSSEEIPANNVGVGAPTMLVGGLQHNEKGGENFDVCLRPPTQTYIDFFNTPMINDAVKLCTNQQGDINPDRLNDITEAIRERASLMNMRRLIKVIDSLKKTENNQSTLLQMANKRKIRELMGQNKTSGETLIKKCEVEGWIIPILKESAHFLRWEPALKKQKTPTSESLYYKVNYDKLIVIDSKPIKIGEMLPDIELSVNDSEAIKDYMRDLIKKDKEVTQEVRKKQVRQIDIVEAVKAFIDQEEIFGLTLTKEKLRQIILSVKKSKSGIWERVTGSEVKHVHDCLLLERYLIHAKGGGFRLNNPEGDSNLADDKEDSDIEDIFNQEIVG